ncbi:hypothetical protein CF319_g6522 [Tilletia indica]|nr:hypothetical protein CF319_g6522 [Tilletia indica]
MAIHIPQDPKLAGVPQTAPPPQGAPMGGSMESSHPSQAPIYQPHHPHHPQGEPRDPLPSRPMPRYRRRGTNPAPLGLLAFATMWWVFGLINVHTRGIPFSNGIIPVAVALGLAMVLSGIFAYSSSPNTWGGTIFILYGCFWVSWALYWIPFFNVITMPTSVWSNSLGCFYSGWLLLSIFLTVASLRTSLVVLIMFGFLDLVYLLLMVSAFTTSTSTALQTSAGAFSMVVAALAAYAGLSALTSRETSPFSLPGFELGDKDD